MGKKHASQYANFGWLHYNRIKADVKQIVADELERIKNNPALAHLLQQK